VKPVAFEYLAPRDVGEALLILTEYGAEAKVLAGGQSLVPLMNFRLARPAYLVDINEIAALCGIGWCDGHVKIGATTRQRDTATDPGVRERVPILAEAISFIGHVAIQNRGTIGGSIAHADPAAELPVIALALKATIDLQRTSGTRSVAAEEFFKGYLSTALDEDEILTATTFCVPPEGTGWCFTEIARRHGDFALVAVATLLTLDTAGTIAEARIALGGVGPAPLRARTAEQLLIGEAPTEEAFRAAAAALEPELDPPDDIHASSDYRRHVAGVLARRALATAASRAHAAAP
jgi:aerobic carbon-monoxide dehydrogenase medium subunit